MESLACCAADANDRLEILWGCHKEKDPRIASILSPAGTRAQFFEHVDMHRLLPALRDALKLGSSIAGFGPQERAKRASWLQPPYEQIAPNAETPGCRLLLSRHGVVPISGRDTLLQDFAQWCDGSGLAIRLVTGQGGEGKSRLLRELCKRQIDRGWTAGLLKEPPNVEDICREVRAGRSCLFAIDYAESWGEELAEALKALHQAATDRAPVRVVLAARAQAEWWTSLPAEANEVRALDPDDLVLALRAPQDELTATWTEAVIAFARARGREAPDMSAPKAELLARWREQGVLTLHAAALLASEGEVPDASAKRAALFDQLLRKEAQLWKRRAREYVAPQGSVDRLLRRVATVATLVGPLSTVAAARDLLRLTPGLGGIGEATLDGLARVFAELYPHPEGRKTAALPPIQPDRVGERLVASEAKVDPALACLPFEHGTAEQATRALRILGRAARDEEDWESLVLLAARTHPLAVVRAWIEVAQKEPWALGVARQLEAAVGPLDDLDPNDAETLAEAIPLQSVSLRGIAATLSLRSLAQLDETAGLEAQLRNTKRLDDLGSSRACGR